MLRGHRPADLCSGGWAQRMVLTGCAALGLVTGFLRAGTISIPNASFESPVTASVDTRIDSWQKTPKPVWWDEAQYGPWDQLVGAFANPAPADSSRIDNCDGNQAIWLFANPQVGLFQDYNSTDWTGSVPSHAFDVRFEAGKSYQLTVGLLVGTAYHMTEGATLELSLYYLDAASNRVSVAATSVTNDPSVFSNGTHLLDFQVNVPTVKNTDPWTGQHLGVQMLSTIGFGLQAGGYWDLDNIRLTSYREPTLSGAAVTGGHFSFTLESEPGTRFEILGSSDLALPSADWASVGFVTNETGRVAFTDPAPLTSLRFYRAKQSP
jgi:hypothetical protein